MRFSQVAYLTLSALSFVAESAPFTPLNGNLQQSRRRAIDYPILSANTGDKVSPHRKRALNYSVVQVDGSSPTSQAAGAPPPPPPPPPPQTVVHTVTEPPVTETLLYTTVIQDHETPKTIVVTSTKVREIHVPAPTNVGFVSGQPVVMAAPITRTVVETIVMATPTTTRYYDDGLWHTYYPMKSWFVPPTPTSTPDITPEEPKIFRRGSPRPLVAKSHKKRALSMPGLEDSIVEQPAAPRHRLRKVLKDLHQTDWNVTRTELDGLRKFMK